MKKALKILSLALVLIMSASLLLSCGAKPNSDPEVAEKALEEAGYSVDDRTNSCKYTPGYEKVQKVLYARGGPGMNIKDLEICYFETKEDADEAWDNIQKYIENAEKASWSPSTFVSGKSGNIIYYGNKELIKIAK